MTIWKVTDRVTYNRTIFVEADDEDQAIDAAEENIDRIEEEMTDDCDPWEAEEATKEEADAYRAERARTRLVKMTCAECGSENVTRDALAEWDRTKQEWVVRAVLDNADCNDCAGECRIEEKPIKSERDDEIVTRSAPRWAWEIIDETLSTDARSSAFDRNLRAQIEAAYDAMIQACEKAED